MLIQQQTTDYRKVSNRFFFQPYRSRETQKSRSWIPRLDDEMANTMVLDSDKDTFMRKGLSSLCSAVLKLTDTVFDKILVITFQYRLFRLNKNFLLILCTDTNKIFNREIMCLSQLLYVQLPIPIITTISLIWKLLPQRGSIQARTYTCKLVQLEVSIWQ